MMIKKINNTSEIYTFNELVKGLEGIEAMICPKLPISDVIDSKIKNSLSIDEKNLFNKSHFDFVITDKNHLPLFAVEFDGPHHEFDEKQKIRDIRKNRICQLSKLPLIRVTDFQLKKIDSISILQFIAYRYVKWLSAFPKIHTEWEEEISNMTNEELKQITSNGYLSPTYDPHFRFDISFPFPLRNSIIMNLKKKNKLFNFLEVTGHDLFWYSVFQGGESSIKGHYTTSYHYGIYKGKSLNSNLSWENGLLKTKGVKILKEDKIQFGMKWALITAKDFDPDTPPILYEQNKGFLPIYHSNLSGANIPAICKAISEYLCYKELLEYVEENNIRNSI